ncbi:MAG: hypothetical protein H6993_16725 [Pseudomonadales bacterium]|nr:hypothetical protein [Pseudomonadales bacterium]MCP5185612.1 hypothetical protein [Pseudomonadales bacterium]
MTTDANVDSLDKALTGLPRELTPGRDLWPGIERRLTAVPARRRAPWLPAVAALVVIAGGLLMRFGDDAGQQLRQLQARRAFDSELADYRHARAVYARDWAAQREGVDPEVARLIERNLTIVQGAQADVARALAAQPDNPDLRGMLRFALQSELSIYEEARTLTATSI